MSRWSKISGLGAVMMVARSLAAVISPALPAGLADRQTDDAADPPPVNFDDGYPSSTTRVTRGAISATRIRFNRLSFTSSANSRRFSNCGRVPGISK